MAIFITTAVRTSNAAWENFICLELKVIFGDIKN
jgi:hypothetical protein